MSDAVEQLKTRASALSSPERADLAYYLLSSLEPEESEVDESWQREIARRATEVRNGSAVGRVAEDVVNEIRKRFP